MHPSEMASSSVDKEALRAGEFQPMETNTAEELKEKFEKRNLLKTLPF